MRAAFLSAPGQVEVGGFAEPVITEGQVLVRMEYASVCGTDLHVVYDGFHGEGTLNQPGYPGHEGVGVVIESRSAQRSVGERVLTVPPGRLGRCFAEYQGLDDRYVLPLPDGDPRRLAMAQQLGTTMFALKRFWPGDEPGGAMAIVLGAGSAGLFFTQLLVQRGFEQVVVCEVVPERRAVAERLGATRTVADVSELKAGADLVIEAVGLDALRAAAVDLVAERGVVGCFGYPERHGLAPFPVQAAFRKAAAVHWVSQTQQEPGLASFAEALDAIAAGRIEVDYCLGTTFDLADTPRALAVAAERRDGVVKVGISPL